MMPGDSWCIGSDVPHSARALEDSVAVEMFSPVREDYLRQKAGFKESRIRGLNPPRGKPRGMFCL